MKFSKFYILKMFYSLNDWDSVFKFISIEILGVDWNKNCEEVDDYGRFEKGFKKGVWNIGLVVLLVFVVFFFIICVVLSIFFVKEVNKNGEVDM